MKVVKKVRFLTKDRNGNFVKSDTFQILRERAVISQQSIEESEITYPETGILYIVDEKATAERYELKSSKGKKPKKKETLEFDGLDITEENVEQFAEDNGIALGNIKDVSKKLAKVKDFINKK